MNSSRVCANGSLESFLTGPAMSRPAAATILIADYDGRSRQLCSSTLSANGFTVVAVRDGQEALDATLAILPDFVSATVFLPTISGVDVCRHLKRDKRTRDIPLVLLSSTALLPTQRLRTREAGCDSLLIQPHLPEALCDE